MAAQQSSNVIIRSHNVSGSWTAHKAVVEPSVSLLRRVLRARRQARATLRGKMVGDVAKQDDLGLNVEGIELVEHVEEGEEVLTS